MNEIKLNTAHADLLEELETAEFHLLELLAIIAAARSDTYKLLNDELKSGKNCSILPSCD